MPPVESQARMSHSQDVDSIANVRRNLRTRQELARVQPSEADSWVRGLPDTQPAGQEARDCAYPLEEVSSEESCHSIRSQYARGRGVNVVKDCRLKADMALEEEWDARTPSFCHPTTTTKRSRAR